MILLNDISLECSFCRCIYTNGQVHPDEVCQYIHRKVFFDARRNGRLQNILKDAIVFGDLF